MHNNWQKRVEERKYQHILYEAAQPDKERSNLSWYVHEYEGFFKKKRATMETRFLGLNLMPNAAARSLAPVIFSGL